MRLIRYFFKKKLWKVYMEIIYYYVMDQQSIKDIFMNFILIKQFMKKSLFYFPFFK